MKRSSCYITVDFEGGGHEVFEDSDLEVTGAGALIITGKTNALDSEDDVSVIIPPHQYLRAVASNQE